jgi:hypothetical protein
MENEISNCLKIKARREKHSNIPNKNRSKRRIIVFELKSEKIRTWKK